MKHVALVASPHPRANIRSIDTGRALASPGVHAVLTGDELASETAPLFNGLDIPNVKWFPLAVGMTRYAGEWVAAVVADSRYLAEDAAELVEVDYEPLPAAVEIESLLEPDSPPGPSRPRQQRAGAQDLRMGAGRGGFRDGRARALLPRALGAFVDGADRDFRRSLPLGPDPGDPRRLGVDPDAQLPGADRERARHPDQFGPGAQRRRRGRQLRRQARHQAHRHNRIPHPASSASRCG